jgi:excisionase family DNA binding protein
MGDAVHQARGKAMTDRLAYRIPEVCAMLGISRATLYRRVKTGEIAIHKLGSVSLVSRDALERLLETLPAQRPPTTPTIRRGIWSDGWRRARTG